ncbi:AI-2E family transporter [Mesorhizobium sp. M2D.F.Ca.ET.185.01.1.1]|uniref:AI-2E family transporter n=1 Tax=unclassified Mesorhizobium TaxID=325217 RepID=UPI000FCCC13F|nr:MULTISPECIES: AI-2E family transporter [unclassified Mesorhizobium]TGP74850.1 AI-2E family transporter [bacterium M00.F.Ca.ET.227.01.1.1]TGP84746.1 AI-2E family transporter [bacterium M00.F.Ca.ET.221.01.1.1]TGP87802.1 AI-2E family transporter [bacterium M00.F.Ca.ET.222.01.1.1]TGT97533.1 AI-2E family transporter [bacterium M00.F.Ca.ET.163.01.1.1]TGU21851.1 AI-2E family transporter [bacterium M00.F.Ca.ET.156.01.1.1]TGU42506.1 AI-2E family transporter [bacterium M00.F.Ca.ET.146.01.1.1]TGV667
MVAANRRNGVPEPRLESLLAASRGHPRTVLPTVASVVVTVAALYFGREVFLPIAVALLLTFAIAPVVSWLKRAGVPRIAAVIASVAGAFAALSLFSFVVATQVSDLAQNIPVYQINILTKVRALKENGLGGGIVSRLSGVIERVGQEIDRQEPQLPSAAQAPKREPIPVEVVSHEKPLEVLQNLIGPLLSPLGSAGLVIIVVIFMLMEREDLRDRFIRLVGYGDLHRTTQALQDAGKRVGQYLLMQLVVNIIYAVPITIGLWVLGIPNALLWGLLALALRFVPYIGPIVGALLPLFLALAVAPGWSLLLWTVALFVVVELVIGNVIEPWLYGSHTGLSPLAIIVAAIFWTWLWGPIGLVLSTPLTVCLVVLGRHVPQFEFLDVLFGNEPVLEPHARLYQRLLAGDPDEATDHAEEILEEKYLFQFYDQVAIPALLLGEQDRGRGVMDDEQRRQVADSAMTLVANLDDSAQQEAEEEEAEQTAEAEEKAADKKGSEKKADDGKPAEQGADEEEVDLPDGSGITVLCAGGRGELDDAAAAMLAQVLEVQGAEATRASFADLEPSAVRRLELEAADAVVIGFLNRQSTQHARFMVRRLKRIKAKLRVGIVFWSEVGNGDGEAAAELAGTLNADFVAFGMVDAVTGALSNKPAVMLKPAHRRRRQPARRKQLQAAAE